MARFISLFRHVRRRGLGYVLLSPVDVVLDYDKDLVVQPDLLFVSHARSGILKRSVMGAPDLVLEVLSPNPRVGKLNERLDWFAQYGIREIWLLHQTSRRFEVIRVEQGQPIRAVPADYNQPIRSQVFPEFDRTVNDILEQGID